MPFTSSVTVFTITMAAFECNRCGKCCISLGPHMTIERQLSDRDYYCRCAIDDTVIPVSVEPAFRREIADEYENGPQAPVIEQKACPFLRKNPGGQMTACAVYATRPKVCRDFRCYHFLIRRQDGNVCGKVIGKNTLRSDDPLLEKIWNDTVAGIPSGDPAIWKETVKKVLEGSGYRLDPVE